MFPWRWFTFQIPTWTILLMHEFGGCFTTLWTNFFLNISSYNLREFGKNWKVDSSVKKTFDQSVFLFSLANLSLAIRCLFNRRGLERGWQYCIPNDFNLLRIVLEDIDIPTDFIVWEICSDDASGLSSDTCLIISSSFKFVIFGLPPEGLSWISPVVLNTLIQ